MFRNWPVAAVTRTKRASVALARSLPVERTHLNAYYTSIQIRQVDGWHNDCSQNAITMNVRRWPVIA